MYAELLKTRIDSLGNGLTTDESIWRNAECELTKIIYQIYDNRGVEEVQFGIEAPIAVTTTSHAAAISNVVGYGWELCNLGASLVVVEIFGERFVCNPLEGITRADFERALGILTRRVGTVPKDGVTRPVTVYSTSGVVDGVVLHYDPPERQASRSVYLGNLGRYLSLVFGLPIQLNLRTVRSDYSVSWGEREACTILASYGMLEDQGFEVTATERLVNYLREHCFKLYADVCTSDEHKEKPLSFSIQLGNHTYKLALWGGSGPRTTTVPEIKSLVQKAFETLWARVKVIEN